MAAIDVGGHGKRDTNHEIPLIPFIDFLLCLVMFLLVTAVWSHMARLRSDAELPGQSGPPQGEPERELHVDMTSEKVFRLSWRQGTTVVESHDVARKPVLNGDTITFPELSSAVERAFRTSGVHTKPTDMTLDRAVLHSSNSDSFAEVSAVLDALSRPKRELTLGSEKEQVPAFRVAFAVD